MIEYKKAPKIRFAGFTDAWEQRKWSDIFVTLPNNSLSRAELNTEDGLIKDVHYGDILIKYGEVLDVSKEEIPYILNQKYQCNNAALLQNGDVLIADAAEDETVGKCSEIAGLSNQKILSGLHTIPCRPIKKFSRGYLGYYMNSGSYHDQLLPLIQGTKISSISKSALKDTTIIYPNVEEQEQIGAFFTSIDNLITLHQRKYDKLVIMKKSMLEKMFPKNGSNVPEIRFAGFNDAWEQRKLSEVLIRRQMYQQISKDTPRLAFAAGQGVIPLIERKTNNRDQLIADEAAKRYLLTEYNDIVYNPANLKYGAIDRNKYGRGVISPIYVTFTTEKVPSFIERIVVSEKFKIKALQFEEGTVVKRQMVNPENLLSFEEWISPNKEEQQQIGVFFDNLDNLITLHQCKLEKLKKIKKSMLEKMFV